MPSTYIPFFEVFGLCLIFSKQFNFTIWGSKTKRLKILDSHLVENLLFFSSSVLKLQSASLYDFHINCILQHTANLHWYMYQLNFYF